eukprot:12030788-Ditylum_brightwellii.AAC.1
MMLVKFGMKSTLIQLRDKYYKYKGAAGASVDKEDIGLAIGGFESAWHADLVTSYLLEMTENRFTKTITKGIYCDDGLVMFSGVKSRRELRRWQKRFQQQINNITGGDFLQFTVEIWMPPSKDKPQLTLPMILEEDNDNKEEEVELTKEGKVVVKEGNPEFKVYQKKGQALKYVDKQSLHRQS